jgi:hypothetical protein
MIAVSVPVLIRLLSETDDRTMMFEMLEVMAIVDSHGTSSAIEAGETV